MTKHIKRSIAYTLVGGFFLLTQVWVYQSDGLRGLAITWGYCLLSLLFIALIAWLMKE